MVKTPVILTLLLLISTGDSISRLLKKGRCLIPRGVNSIVRTILFQQCLSQNQAEGNETSCYNELGCFPMGTPWTNNLRPFPSPMPPSFIETKLYLYTRSSPDRFSVVLWPEISLGGSSFANNKPTVFITHGFANNGNNTWIANMKDNYLKRVDANVFLVDWGKGASLMNYLQVASNTRIVGAELARFIQYLICNLQLDPHNIHLIGHSLGAHVSGYTAKKVNGIGRITALDPAQPGFESQPKEVRLDSGDANYVDVIHTNSRPFIPLFGFGMIFPVGHVDIYVNGGLVQPGCFDIKIPKINSISDLAYMTVEAIQNIIGCSHGLSHTYFSESLIANCTIWGRKANFFDMTASALSLGRASIFTKVGNKCGEYSCTVLGLDALRYKARGTFLAKTNIRSPFCDYNPSYDSRVQNEIQYTRIRL